MKTPTEMIKELSKNKCQNCGETIPINTKFCGVCINILQVVPKKKDNIIRGYLG